LSERAERVGWHPEEIVGAGGTHFSRANFTQNTSIELEADHFASGLLLPSKLTRHFLSDNQIGLDGILKLADEARCSVTAAAIRAAECGAYPMAVIVSKSDQIAYAFTSDAFKNLGKGAAAYLTEACCAGVEELGADAESTAA
jgi:Zn-dependent peptidase ImmA (M78 family)